MPSFACKDIGMACEFKTTATTEAELMKKIAEHEKRVLIRSRRFLPI
ncbi:MAG: DUF1059 domain-containing protein [Methanoregula sp.]